MTGPAIGTDTTVALHALSLRPDREHWYVGRVDIGEFIAVPPIAVEALRLLGTGAPAGAVRDLLREGSGRDIDVAGFVSNLVDLGFVASVDGRPVAGPLPCRPTLPWLRARHVRWTLHPLTAAVVLAVPVLAVVVAVTAPELVPTYRDLIWNDRGSLVLAGNAAIGWTLILLHELGHLATARAAGVPARMSFGTRLQFLVAQTDVTGVWTAARRVRYTVYLSGMAVTLAIGAAALLLRPLAGPDTGTGAFLAAVAFTAVLFTPGQFRVFMRTDLYYVLQDMAGCRNLYADGGAYARYRARRVWSALTRSLPAPVDPSTGLSRRERWAVRAYSVLLVIGTVAFLAIAVLVTIPVTATLLWRAGGDLTAGAAMNERVDGLITFTVIGGMWALWARAWWRRHGPRIRRSWSRLTRSAQRRHTDPTLVDRPGAGRPTYPPRRREVKHGGDCDPQARQDRDDRPLRDERDLTSS